MINEKLNLILKDNTSGSTELLQKIIDFFLINAMLNEIICKFNKGDLALKQVG